MRKKNMSDQGKLFRGERYHAMRNKEGEYPEGIKSNPDKKADLDFYLDSIKEEPKASGEKKEDKKKEVK